MPAALPPSVTTVAALRRRLIPFLFLLYVVAYLDRVNIGFAALDMNRDLGFSATVYGLGSGIFFISYTLLEVPSNLILARVGARAWIGRIMLTWGLVSIAMAFVRDTTSFYLLRFLLGAAEAGFFPGIIYYLTQWFPARERAHAIALFMTGTAIAGVIGGPISSGLLLFDGVLGLRGNGCSWSKAFPPSCLRRSCGAGSTRGPPTRAGSRTPNAAGWSRRSKPRRATPLACATTCAAR